jgi:hypothetical protein
MTEQPPSAEATTLLSEIIGSCGRAGMCRFPPCSCAESIDALIAQRVSAETERWQNRDRQRLEQIDRLQETVQQFQSAQAEHPAPEPTCEGGVPLGTMGTTCPKCGATDNDVCGYMGAPAERPAPPQRHLTGGEREVLHKALLASSTLVHLGDASAVMDYTERAREIVRKSTFVYGSSIDGEPNHSWIDATTAQKEIAAALSAVASERQTAAIRAFGGRVWSDTEEVAYQAGATDEHADLLTQCQEQRHRAQDAEAEIMALLARLHEPDEELVEAVTRVICPQRWENLNAGEQEREKSYARAVLTKIAEILK